MFARSQVARQPEGTLGPRHGRLAGARYFAVLCDALRHLAINHDIAKVLAKPGVLATVAAGSDVACGLKIPP